LYRRSTTSRIWAVGIGSSCIGRARENGYVLGWCSNPAGRRSTTPRLAIAGRPTRADRRGQREDGQSPLGTLETTRRPASPSPPAAAENPSLACQDLAGTAASANMAAVGMPGCRPHPRCGSGGDEAGQSSNICAGGPKAVFSQLPPTRVRPLNRAQ
jgi:hypothetical protein